MNERTSVFPGSEPFAGQIHHHYSLRTLTAMYRGVRLSQHGGWKMFIRANVDGIDVYGRVVALGTKIDVRAIEAPGSQRADDMGAMPIVQGIRPEWVTYAEVI